MDGGKNLLRKAFATLGQVFMFSGRCPLIQPLALSAREKVKAITLRSSGETVCTLIVLQISSKLAKCCVANRGTDYAAPC